MAYLRLFPLNLVAYPGELLNLHIFEPRYRQLINECLETEESFGIPCYVENKLPGYGTEVRITTLSKRYDDGRLDIKTRGERVFRLTTFENPQPGKLYAGGTVQFVSADDAGSTAPLPQLVTGLERLYDLLQIDPDVDPLLPGFSYNVAHKVGLTLEQEYELLTLDTEADRQQFLLAHLTRVLPVVATMEKTKERIRQNGHFKNLDPLTF